MDATQLKLIEALSDGRFHGGDDLGRAVGLSRAAVGKRLVRFADIGLRVDAVKGKGYKLSQAIDLIDRQTVLDTMTSVIRSKIERLDLVPVTESTNQDAMAATGTAGYRVVVSDYQTAARGRRGKRWEQGFASSLTFSIAKDFNLELKHLSQMSLWTAVAVAEALDALYAAPVRVKWPNDIYVGGKKLAGILLEARAEVGGTVRLVVGVGINVSQQGLVGAAIDQPWISLSELPQRTAVNRSQLLGRMVDGIVDALDSTESASPDALRGRWQKFDMLLGQMVDVHSVTQTLTGECQGIDADGNLSVLIDGRLHSLNAGEVTIRRATL